MNIFLSWSGSRSKKTAEVLGEYLQQMIQAVEPWISSDISKGANWVKEIGSKLEEINFGILCLTRENLNENWILFEAGALSKKQGAHVCTFLLDLKHADIKPPLSLFQHTVFDKEDIQKLLHTINNEARKLKESKMTDDSLNKVIERYWSDLDNELKKIVATSSGVSKPIRSEREMLEEILEITRAGKLYPPKNIGSIPIDYSSVYYTPSSFSPPLGELKKTVHDADQIQDFEDLSDKTSKENVDDLPE